MLTIWLILAAIALLCFSGLPGCLGPLRSSKGQLIATVLMVLGSAAGLTGLIMSVKSTAVASLSVKWFLPWGQFLIKLDSLSMFFLVPIFVVPLLGSIYGLSYWKHSRHRDNACRVGLFYGLLAGSMAMVVIARDTVLFLIAWEVMAMAAYFAAAAEDNKFEVRKAGWIYLIATHAGTLFLISMFMCWRHASGSFAFESAVDMPAKTAGIIFMLALVGFGFKAGIMPLHLWLPGAHANAPSHVSAVMSSVMLKMGIYGIVRMAALLPMLTGRWGAIMIAVGAASAIAGIAFAIGQRDLKRVLAYSSIENIGIITMAIGLALVGRAYSRSELVVLGLGGAFLHVWNHAAFKSLLFLNAGAVIHAVHTRDIDRLGGLGKQMPSVMILFIIGAASICGLPPLNGFVSEWLIYIGLFKTLSWEAGQGMQAAALGVTVLAMVGALAAACFVKLLGTVFLGSPRSSIVHAEDAPASMLIPMIIAAGFCALIGLFPLVLIEMINKAVNNWLGDTVQLNVESYAGLRWLTVMGMALIILLCVIIVVFAYLPRVNVRRRCGTWDCGYANPTARMQYSGSSFGQTLVRLFNVVLWPKTYWKGLGAIFSNKAYFKIAVQDVILDRMVLPLFSLSGRYLPVIRILQQGRTHLYILYILVTVIALLLFGAMGI